MGKMLTILVLVCFLIFALFFIFAGIKKAKIEAAFKAYVDYFKTVYEIMEKNYYLPVNNQTYEAYVSEFKAKIFDSQLEDKTKLNDGVKHIATGILIARLKDPLDHFTNFFPPQMVKEFKQSVLGYGGDIGIEGTLIDGKFSIRQVEPRSDAFKKGISIGDEIIKIENTLVTQIPPEAITKLFSPPAGEAVNLEIFSPKTNAAFTVSVISSQYFKQSVFRIPTADEKVACLKIKFFNQETGNDLRLFLDEINKNNISRLIIDLRDNGGGPPLAAWDISGIFLDPEQRLFYFKKREETAMGLIVPESTIRYNGDIAILMNKNTGSAAEIFAGFMQAYRRALLIGENSAGKVYLKSLFDLPDGATIELTVARGYLFTGNPIDISGLKPDMSTPDSDKLLPEVVNLMAGK